ncbi:MULTISPECIES: alpha/beta hydrolase [Chryseobacterium]|uniref:alpha/beta hydrolase n=1 Tax=Chryseobacterium TaxID=59732 RepID=UPI000FA3BE30|nr:MULTISPECIES: alpha/beta hydrolase [Chryseobacterium]MBM7417503.1 acetyl esterase/lipase [Chryseobacterium sp. JUb44]MDH6211695.1 acetyl esterase/lipase [Chryseobacterium sp. BIGb0186]WSO10338.1 alpha/beta hydrolase [Chryseobacterium scophthalmum]
MKKFILVFSIFLGIQISAQQKIMVWQKGEMPNSKGLKLNTIEEKEGRITQIQEAELFAFLPAKEERKPIAIIIIPGGGYRHLTYDLGGYSYAKWLNTLGISAFVLNYRLPTSPDLKQRELGPLQDIQAAIKLIRKNAAQYGISPDQIGVLGTSAGGHLAAMVSNISTDYTELRGDWSTISTVPNFAILVSPVIDLGEFAHKGSRINLLGENASQEKIAEYSMQNKVTEKTPPTILFHAQNDNAVPVINSILYYEAMIKNKVKGSLFIFPKGEHNIGISNKTELTDNWKKLCADWLGEMSNK